MERNMLFSGRIIAERLVRPCAGLLAVAGLGTALSGCGSEGGMPPEPPAAVPVVPVVPLLQAHPGCPSTLFAEGTPEQDLSTEAAYSVGWKGAWVQPQIENGALALGPHPMTMDWWDNYSPTTSKQKPGDVMLCARVRMTPEVSGSPGDNTFELTMRLPDGASFETSGMTLDLEANAAMARLRTRASSDVWNTYDEKPLAGEPGTALVYELLLFGQGSRFLAEARNTKTGQVVVLRANATLPAGGAVTMLGWRNRFGAYVERLVIGQPALSIAGTLLTELSP